MCYLRYTFTAAIWMMELPPSMPTYLLSANQSSPWNNFDNDTKPKKSPVALHTAQLELVTELLHYGTRWYLFVDSQLIKIIDFCHAAKSPQTKFEFQYNIFVGFHVLILGVERGGNFDTGSGLAFEERPKPGRHRVGFAWWRGTTKDVGPIRNWDHCSDTSLGLWFFTIPAFDGYITLQICL